MMSVLSGRGAGCPRAFRPTSHGSSSSAMGGDCSKGLSTIPSSMGRVSPTPSLGVSTPGSGSGLDAPSSGAAECLSTNSMSDNLRV